MEAFFLVMIVIVLLSLSVHEYAHAAIADAAGDPTPGVYGRVTLNPLKHLDPIGTLFIVMSSLAGFGFGWAKPVPMNPSRMRNPRRDHFWAVIGGPLSNLALALVAAVLLQTCLLVGLRIDALIISLFLAVMINIALCLFNLFPIGPLDGMWIVSTFLPEPMRTRYIQFNLTAGQFVFLFMILPIFNGTSIIGAFLLPLSRQLQRLLIPGVL